MFDAMYVRIVFDKLLQYLSIGRGILRCRSQCWESKKCWFKGEGDHERSHIL